MHRTRNTSILIFTGIFGGLVILSIIASLIDPVLAVYGSYTIVGLVIAAGANLLSNRGIPLRLNELPYLQVQLIFALLMISTTAILGTRLIPILIFLTIGYVLIGVQIFSNSSWRSILIQILLLYSLGPITRYLTTGFFYGKTDVFAYVQNTGLLIQEGGLHNFTDDLANFAGTYILVAITGLITGVPTYELLTLIGITTYLFFICIVFLWIRSLTGNVLLAMMVSLAFSSIYIISYFPSYFVRLAFGVPIMYSIMFLVLGSNRNKSLGAKITQLANQKTSSILAYVFAVALVIIHHQTIFLVFALLAMIYGYHAVSNTSIFKHRRWILQSDMKFYYSIIIVAMVLSLSYWIYNGHFFIRSVFITGISRFQDFSQAFIVSSQSRVNIYEFGINIPENTVKTALMWLFTGRGVHQSVLVAVFASGVGALITNPQRYSRIISLAVAGIISGAILFRTPLSVGGLFRFRLVAAPVFAIIIGIGLYHVSFPEKERQKYDIKVVPLILIVLLGVSGPLAMANDIDGSRPDRFMIEDESLSPGEFSSIRKSSHFAKQYEAEVTTFRVESRALEMFGVDSNPLSASPSQIQVESGLFLYQQSWTSHRVQYDPPEEFYGVAIFFSKESISRLDKLENKVYTNDKTRMVWVSNQTRFQF